MARRKYTGVDTVLSERPFSLILEFPSFEEIDQRQERNEFAFQIMSSIDNGVTYPFEMSSNDLDALLVETFGSNLDELSPDIHLPASSRNGLADH